MISLEFQVSICDLHPTVVSLASGLSQQGVTASSASHTANATAAAAAVAGAGGILCVCGIRFSNVANLEAHRMFYCTHRPLQQGGCSLGATQGRGFRI